MNGNISDFIKLMTSSDESNEGFLKNYSLIGDDIVNNPFLNKIEHYLGRLNATDISFICS